MPKNSINYKNFNMAKYVFLIAALLFSITGFPQEHFRKEQITTPKNTQFGFILSPNIGWMHVDNIQGYNTKSVVRPGFSCGVLADLNLTSNYFFSTAIIVTGINGRLNYPNIADIISTNYKLQYIEIPLTLKLKTNLTTYGRFYGQFGLGTGIKISGTETGGSIEGPINHTTEVGNDFRASLIAGAGTEWAISSGLNLQTGLVLNYGLTNAASSLNYNFKNNYLMLSLGLFF
ncbi:MAG: PorT family protein [Sphingobacteriaceae bacterium]|nr:MAG: PorT family protein [Sphingobacteriaceae bacterium]